LDDETLGGDMATIHRRNRKLRRRTQASNVAVALDRLASRAHAANLQAIRRIDNVLREVAASERRMGALRP
jgi:hypothetical protein